MARPFTPRTPTVEPIRRPPFDRRPPAAASVGTTLARPIARAMARLRQSPPAISVVAPGKPATVRTSTTSAAQIQDLSARLEEQSRKIDLLVYLFHEIYEHVVPRDEEQGQVVANSANGPGDDEPESTPTETPSEPESVPTEPEIPVEEKPTEPDVQVPEQIE